MPSFDLEMRAADNLILRAATAASKGDLKTAVDKTKLAYALFPENPAVRNALRFYHRKQQEVIRGEDPLAELLAIPEARKPVKPKRLSAHNMLMGGLVALFIIVGVSVLSHFVPSVREALAGACTTISDSIVYIAKTHVRTNPAPAGHSATTVFTVDLWSSDQQEKIKRLQSELEEQRSANAFAGTKVVKRASSCSPRHTDWEACTTR